MTLNTTTSSIDFQQSNFAQIQNWGGSPAFPTPGTSMTVWVKLSVDPRQAQQQWVPFLYKSTNHNVRDWGLTLRIIHSGTQMRIEWQTWVNAAHPVQIFAHVPFQFNQIFTMTATYEFSTKNVQMFHNGGLVGSGNWAGRTLGTTSSLITVGGSTYSNVTNHAPLYGKVYEILFFDSVLSASQIHALESQTGVSCCGLCLFA